MTLKTLRPQWFDIIAVVLGLLPLVINFSYELPYEPPKIILLLFLALVITVGVVFFVIWSARKYNEQKFVFTLLDKAVLVWLASIVVSTIVSVSTTLSFFGSYERRMGLLYYLGIVVIYFFLRVTLNQRRTHQLLSYILYVSVIVCVYGTIQHFSVDFYPELVGAFRLLCHGGPVRIFSTFGHPNFLGAYLAIIFPLALYFLFTARHVTKKIFWIIVAILQTLTIVWTFSRSAWLAACVASLIITIYWIKCRKINIRCCTKISGIIVAGFLIVIVLGQRSAPNNWYVQRIASFSDANSGSILIRMNDWKYLGQYIIKKPIIGYGLETLTLFYVERPKDTNEKLPDCNSADPSFPDRAHNQILDILLASGAIGLIAWLFMVSVAFWYCFKKGVHQFFRASIGASLVAYLVQNQFNFDFSISVLLFVILLACVQSDRARSDASHIA